jgi:hypothetical protein
MDPLFSLGQVDHIRQAFDLQVAEAPEGYFTPAMVAEHGPKALCLVIVAERGA